MKIGTIICIAALASLLSAGCSEGPRTETPAAPAESHDPVAAGIIKLPPDSPKLRQIKVETVQLAQLPGEEIVSPGRVESNPNRVSRVVLPVPGRLAKVLVKLGDRITAGQPLLELESPDVEAAMSSYLQAEGGVTQAKAILVKAQRDQERAADLYSHKAIAQKEVLSAESTMTQAQAGLEQAEAQREQVLRRLQLLGLKPGVFGQKLIVTAPSSGKVLEMNAAQGEYRNDISAPLMTIADLSTVWVTANIPENNIRLIQVGGKIKITLLAFPGVTFQGQIRRIADTVDPQTRTVKVMAELENLDGRFRPDMYGEVRYIASIKESPAAPVGAVIQTDEGPAVFVEKTPGEFRRTLIKVGQLTDGKIPVFSGVQPGDRIVVDGVMLLKTQ
jgi:membrane fusion protein, heavy metal efflux system